jgi:type 1 glutamine amidotransferase
MKRLLSLFALAAALGVAFCTSTTPDDANVRVLLFTRTAGFRHESIEPAVAAIRSLAVSAGGSADATDDPRMFNAADLARYDVVVFLMTTGDVLDDEQQAALTDFVRSGGGFAGVHSATDTEYDWPWYGQLVGAWFAGHPSNPGVRQGRLLVRSTDHPATRSLPSTWIREDEWYDFRDVQPGSTVLLDIDEASYKTAAENPAAEPRPIAWVRAFDGGRSFYTALGHTSESCSEPLFLEHVWGGIVDAAGERSSGAR